MSTPTARPKRRCGKCCAVVNSACSALHAWPLPASATAHRREDRTVLDAKIESTDGSHSRVLRLCAAFVCVLCLFVPVCSTRIRWDEETIAKHDEERGTRQRVRPLRRVSFFSHSVH